MAVIERLDFLGVPTQDPERSRAFYRGVLVRPDEHAEWEQWAGATCFAIWSPKQACRSSPRRATVPLRCDDVAVLVLEAKGVQFFGDTFDTGVCHMAIFADPDGNELMPHTAGTRRTSRPARSGRHCCLAPGPRATGMPRQTRARRPGGVSSVPVETLACRGAEVSVRRV